ncbi:MAG: hypothetical protein GY868_04195 [Deltaproteobacteria bacterium]|nr:hypothetical protein [Deltaproteobacteria bacterium]
MLIRIMLVSLLTAAAVCCNATRTAWAIEAQIDSFVRAASGTDIIEIINDIGSQADEQTPSSSTDNDTPVPDAPAAENDGLDVTVRSPDDAAGYAHQTMVLFAGSATDSAGRSVPDGLFVWTSSSDGIFGAGPSLRFNGLSPGEHLITLSVTDNNGRSGSDIINLKITAETAPAPDDSNHCAASCLFNKNDPRQETLRLFRDRVLAKLTPGSILIRRYYACSAQLTHLLQLNPSVRSTLKTLLLTIFPAIEHLTDVPSGAY